MKDSTKCTGYLILTFFIGTVFGSGAIWQWRQTEISKERFEFEKLNSLRENREKRLRTVVTLDEEFRRIKDTEPNQTTRLLFVQLSNAVEDYNGIERELATLEHRQPLTWKVEGEFPKEGITLDYLAPAAPK